MSAAPTGGSTAVAGATVVEARALHRLTTGIVQDAARVGADDVSVELTDRRGDLRVSVVVPVLLGNRGDGDVRVRADAVRDAVMRGMRELAARRVAAVDVRFAGVRRESERRVA
ncbi:MULTISPECIES: hypothetical protein [Microbacterium]|uniref:hypothetical protein n=1 Tax=Microbacterium TaxID=33882 RepID=UPI0011EB395F|nr:MULTISPECIES: hypothetical protein [Microbacterium]